MIDNRKPHHETDFLKQSGKSTVAKALKQRPERSLHIPLDNLHQMFVSGLSDMAFEVPPAAMMGFPKEESCPITTI
jgi:hypothetical protein